MDQSALSPLIFTLLACAGFAGGLIDAIAGGGGLITVPALLAAGLPPQVALGTNKMQSACGTLLAVVRYGRAGLLRSPGIPLAACCAFVAGAAGAWAVSMAPPDLLRRIIPWLLAAVAVYTMMNRRFGQEIRKPVVSAGVFAVTGGLMLGFYDGFFGPGAGSFWTVGLVGLLGLDLRHATGFTKTANLASNLGALTLFAAYGAVHLPIAAAMIGGQLLGARLGSGLVIRKGAALIRPVFLAVVLALTLKLLLDAWRA
ncbi:MAG: TSUP family transporter [Verrucomicrobiota bacterium]